MIDEKNRVKIISWHCPFKRTVGPESARTTFAQLIPLRGITTVSFTIYTFPLCFHFPQINSSYFTVFRIQAWIHPEPLLVGTPRIRISHIFYESGSFLLSALLYHQTDPVATRPQQIWFDEIKIIISNLVISVFRNDYWKKNRSSFRKVRIRFRGSGTLLLYSLLHPA